MTSDLDTYRAANELIKDRGLKGASDYAADRIHTLLELGDQHGAKVWVSDGCGGETIPMTVRIGSCQSRFEGYLGNVS